MEPLSLLLLLTRAIAMTFFSVEAMHLLIYARHSHIYRMYGGLQLLMGMIFGLIIFSQHFSQSPYLYEGHTVLLCNVMVPAVVVICYELLKGKRMTLNYLSVNFIPFILSFMIYSVSNNQTFLFVTKWLSLAYATIAMVLLQVMMLKEIRRHDVINEKRAYSWFALMMWAMYFSLFLPMMITDLDRPIVKIIMILLLIAVYAIITFLLRRGMLDFHILQQEEFNIQMPAPASSVAVQPAMESPDPAPIQSSVQPAAESPAAIQPSEPPVKPIPTFEEMGEQLAYIYDQFSYYGDKIRQLNELMETKRLYLDPNLTAATLSIELGTNRTYLSNLINQYLHTTFSNYVNAYRVKYAKNLLLNTDDTIEDIFQVSGFQSRTTFWRAFAQVEGCTPKEFRRRAALNDNQPITPD